MGCEIDIRQINLALLRAHPANCNVMPKNLFEKLVEHIRHSGRYPPIIVRRVDDSGYQILDGHHRVAALEKIGVAEAQCVVWDVGEDEALVLLGTLNRLSGYDDVLKRSALVAELNERFEPERLVRLLPEGREAIDRLLYLSEAPPVPRKPVPLEEAPVAVHFFLLPSQRRLLESRLKTIGGTREEALMRMVCQAG